MRKCNEAYFFVAVFLDWVGLILLHGRQVDVTYTLHVYGKTACLPGLCLDPKSSVLWALLGSTGLLLNNRVQMRRAHTIGIKKIHRLLNQMDILEKKQSKPIYMRMDGRWSMVDGRLRRGRFAQAPKCQARADSQDKNQGAALEIVQSANLSAVLCV